MEETIDKNSAVPLYMQLERALRAKISMNLAVGESIGTIDEIAKFYGVSAITVKATLCRLTKAGFIRGIKGKGFFVAGIPQKSEKKSGVIGFSAFIGEHSILNPMYVRIFEGASSVFNAASRCFRFYRPEEIVQDGMIEKENLEGIILAGFNNTSFHDELYAKNIKFVLADLKSEIYPSVITDNRLGARLAVEHLIGLGHKEIAIVNGNTENMVFADRFEAYRDVLHENGIRIRKSFIVDDPQIPLAYKSERMEELLRGSSRPTAVFFSSDLFAFFYIPHLLKIGLCIPEDLSVIGFDDREAAFYMEPSLTTVKQPMFDVGAAAAKILLASSRKNVLSKPLMLPPKLVVRSSCRGNAK